MYPTDRLLLCLQPIPAARGSLRNSGWTACLAQRANHVVLFLAGFVIRSRELPRLPVKLSIAFTGYERKTDWHVTRVFGSGIRQAMLQEFRQFGSYLKQQAG